MFAGSVMYVGYMSRQRISQSKTLTNSSTVPDMYEEKWCKLASNYIRQYIRSTHMSDEYRIIHSRNAVKITYNFRLQIGPGTSSFKS